MVEDKDNKREELELIFSSTGFNFNEFDSIRFIEVCRYLMKRGEVIVSESFTDPNGIDSRVRITHQQDGRRYLVEYHDGRLSVT